MERLNKLIAQQKADVDLLNKSEQSIRDLRTRITERNGRIQERQAMLAEAKKRKADADAADEAQAV